MSGSAGPARRPTRGWGAAALRAWWADSPRRWPPSTLWTLVWLSSLLYAPLFYPDHLVALGLGVVVTVLFAAFYLGVYLRPGPLRNWAEVVTTVVAVVTTPVNAGGAILLVYAAGFAGSFRPRRVALRWFAGMTALVVLLAGVSSISFPWRIWAFGPSLVLIWVVGLLSMEAAAEERAAQAHNAQVEHLATVAERERISRDLHDLLGHTLTAIVVRSQLAQRLATVDAQAGVAEMAAVEKAAREALSEVRTTVTGWRQVDLTAELTAASDALTAAGVRFSVTRDTDLVLTPSAESALGLALREAITNVVRHSRASRCAVVLSKDGQQVVLEVSDDGVGGGRDGTGLTGMRERIAALGGEVRRAVHGGTSLVVTVPRAVAT